MRISAHARSDVGLVRQGNEDGVYAGTNAFAVADGMGGHAAGEIASQAALEPVAALDGARFDSDEQVREALHEALEAANHSVVQKAEDDPAYRGMGTTLTAGVVREDRLHMAHVGDSRAYLLRGDEPLTQLTTDHTVVEELMRNGQLSPEDIHDHPQRSVITRAIGIEPGVEIDSLPPLTLEPGDQVLLCSDGLTGPVSDAEIADILRNHRDGESACEALVDAANAAGGPDNITVLLLRATREPAGRNRPSAAGADPSALSTTGPPTEQLHTVPHAPPTPIRTREESNREWAASIGHYGDRPAAPPGGGPASRQSTRMITLVIVVIAVAALLFGGTWLFLSRAWFVGEQDGTVAVYRGVPQEVGGVRLHSIVERTEVDVDDLAPRWERQLASGITFGSEAEAHDLVARLREEAEARQEADDDGGESDEGDRVPRDEPAGSSGTTVDESDGAVGDSDGAANDAR